MKPHYDLIWVNEPMPEDWTCGCGLYVHPKRINPKAIHISDCQYAKKEAIDAYTI